MISTPAIKEVGRKVPPSILRDIVEHKKIEVQQRKELFPIKLLEKSLYFSGPTVSLSHYLKRSDRVGIIAEFKKKSPSKGDINPYANVEKVTLGYMQAGASALSILTDEKFFGGKSEDLTKARKINFSPILRKDFIIDEYQLIEARSIGADAILLIASVLTLEESKHLATQAQSLGLEVLVEVHNQEELEEALQVGANVVGINNRNLHDFTESIETSLQLNELIPAGVVKISESSLRQPEQVAMLKRAGFDGFLLGETFMKQSQPERACANFIQQVQALLGK